nr:hypothetical protein [Tanacetum cinerariifolium]
MEEGLRDDGVKVVGVSLDFVADNSNQPRGSFKSNVDTRTIRVDRQHDGKHRPPPFTSFIYEESIQTKVNVRTLKTELTELADVLIPIMSSVLEVHVRFENTLYGYFLGKKVACLVVERYILNAWQKYGVKRVMKDKNDSKELTFVPLWIKLHGVPVLAFTADRPSAIANHMWNMNGYPRDVVPVWFLVMMVHSVLSVLLLILGSTEERRMMVSKLSKRKVFVILLLANIGQKVIVVFLSSRPESAYQKKTTSTLVSNAFFALEEDDRKPMDDLVDGTRNKARVPLRKTDIWPGRKAKYYLESKFTSPNPFGLLTKKIGIVFCVIYMRVVMMGKVFYVINRRVMMMLK